MNRFDRRTFVQLSTSAMLMAASHRLVSEAEPTVTHTNGAVRVAGDAYTWEYTEADDTFLLRDTHQRLIASGTMQPAVIVAPAGQPETRVCKPGKLGKAQSGPGRVILSYEGVNQAARLTLSWRFDAHGIWTDPAIYESTTAEDVVSLHYFAGGDGREMQPSLHATYLVVPGISEGSAVSPILRDDVHLDQNLWLGRGSFLPGMNQQWGLPVHYFCGFSIDQKDGARDLFTQKRSGVFACGLADLPRGDFFLQLYQGKCSPWIDYRGDLWKHMRGPGRMELGATLLWSVGKDDRQAIANYYGSLLDAGIIQRHQNSTRKTATALTPQFCTWGSQLARGKNGAGLDEAFLTEIYRELKALEMRPGLFSIDDKWEEAYGNLVHSKSRLPHFEQFLDQLRADGYKVGIWAALMRCERPEDLGLTLDNMLQQPDGKPFAAGDFNGSHYYLLDFTQPAVEHVLTRLVKQFIRRYKPDLFKFDFGYELPAVSIAAPQDKRWTGERLMYKGLSVVIKAMREENPDLVVMYYQLSPLFLEFFDLHSTDDLFLAAGEYDLEANRRLYFSSLLGPLGIPSYGSSGYDWASAPSIWFDSVAMGTIGFIADLAEDERGEHGSPERVAKFNGLARLVRPGNVFEVVPFGAVAEAPTYGAHARSWARLEGGKLVLLAFRPVAPGEENTLAEQATHPDLIDAVRAAAPVVVASLDSESISRSNQLAIVSYGSGDILIRRERGMQAGVVCHYLGGRTIPGKASVEDGFLRLRAETHAGNMPLEWIEVQVS